MPRRSDQLDPARQGLPRTGRQVPRPVVTAGVGVALLGVALGVTFRPGSGSDPATQPVAVAADGQQSAALRADALRAAAALRIEERTSRDRTRSPEPTPSAVRTPTARTPTAEPVPAVAGKRWVKAHVNVRSGPSAGSDRIGGLSARSRADITGVTRSGWTQVVLDSRAGWVRSTFLSTSKPVTEARKQKASTAARRASTEVSTARCSKSTSIEPHLKPNARAVYRAVCAAHGRSVSSFGGYRPGDPRDHGSGRAVDIMVSGAPGTRIARYVQVHARELGVTYVIYQQRIWFAGNPTSQWKAMADRGSKTANHYDHVHVSVS